MSGPDRTGSSGTERLKDAPLVDFSGPLVLTPTVQHYAWGMRGECEVKRLAGSAAGAPPYAELWIGAHPKSSSTATVAGNIVGLDRLIAQAPHEMLGQRVLATYGPILPFLLKVLSINEPLSIQAHPHAELAAELHARDPKNYPDCHPKPEMALALTEVKLLCGFRPAEEIASYLDRVPALRTLAGEAAASAFIRCYKHGVGLSAALRRLYANLMSADAEAVHRHSQALFADLQENSLDEADNWVLRLQSNYSEGDVGLFSFYLMNILTLHPEEAVFLAPNTPHAYLSGEMVECMRNSDVVVRAGLTPKHKDVDTLVTMLNYQMAPPSLVKREVLECQTGSCTTYVTPAQEFRLMKYQGALKERLLPISDGPQLLFCTEGMGEVVCGNAERLQMQPGTALFLPATAASARSFLNMSDPESRVFLVEVPALE